MASWDVHANTARIFSKYNKHISINTIECEPNVYMFVFAISSNISSFPLVAALMNDSDGSMNAVPADVERVQ